MGIVYSYCAPVRECKVVVMGLDKGGKTSIVHWILEGKGPEEEPQPTYSFNYHECKKNGYKIRLFDIGGTDRKTTFWRHFLAGVTALIYVIDSTNLPRLSEAKEQLHQIFSFEEMNGVRTLIMANKLDLQTKKICKVASVDLIRKELGLDSSLHEWCIEPCSAATGYGINDGLRWLLSGART